MNMYSELRKLNFIMNQPDFNIIKDNNIKPYRFIEQDGYLGVTKDKGDKSQYALVCNFLSTKMQQRFENAYYHKSPLIKAFGKSLLKNIPSDIKQYTGGQELLTRKQKRKFES